MLFAIAFLSSAVFAQTECPHLQGQWICRHRQGDPAPFTVGIVEGFKGNYPAYTVDSPKEGVTELTADNQERPVNPRIGQGTQSSRCERGRIVTTFKLITPGHPLQVFEDSMYPERGGLVRIFRRIQPAPGPSERVPAFSCKPVILPRH